MKTIITAHEIAQRIWDKESGHPLISLFYPFSFLYRLAVAIRNRFYDWGIASPLRLTRPVISVGNITVGGTGKTPLVIHIARFLKNGGFRPAILSRGYGGKPGSSVNVVADGRKVLLGYGEAGDEPVLMARAAAGVPVIVGPDRHLSGRCAVNRFDCNVLILDDGFQHRRLHRDLDILLVDQEKPFGNGFLLPAGPLREPVASMRRADVVIRTGAVDPASDKAGLPAQPILSAGAEDGPFVSPGIPVLRAYHRPRELVNGMTGISEDLERLRGARVCAFSGIGKPGNFRRTLVALGADVVSFIPFPDHHRYDLPDLRRIEQAAADGKAASIITTEKDGIRLDDFPEFFEKVLLLRIEMGMIPATPNLEEIMLKRLNSIAHE